MSENADPQFDDPALKQTVKAAWPTEKAPSPLRQRVLMAMIGAAPLSPSKPAKPTGTSILNRPLSPLTIGAIAALVAVGIGVWIYLNERALHPQITFTATALPAQVDDEVAKQLINRHDSLLHDRPEAKGSPTDVRQKLI